MGRTIEKQDLEISRLNEYLKAAYAVLLLADKLRHCAECPLFVTGPTDDRCECGLSDYRKARKSMRHDERADNLLVLAAEENK